MRPRSTPALEPLNCEHRVHSHAKRPEPAYQLGRNAALLLADLLWLALQPGVCAWGIASTVTHNPRIEVQGHSAGAPPVTLAAATMKLMPGT